MKKQPKYLIIFLIIILSFIAIFLMNRQFSEREIDDVHPDIPCSNIYLEKSNIIFVIPLFNNHSIADNQTWCKEILRLNKTIGLHGVYHTYNEFNTIRTSDYLDKGIVEFEKCFGYKPRIFKAPQWKLADENEVLLTDFETKGLSDAFIHKTYHCSEEGEFSYRTLGVKMNNKLIDWI